MQDSAIPLLAGLVPILTVLGVELILSSLSLKSVGLRRLLCGKPVILIENGKILEQNLRRTSITLDELTGHLRLKDVLDPRAVQFAILETNGNLSVFPYPKDRPASASEAGIHAKKQDLPITVVADGHLYRENLPLLGKDEAWVERVLAQKNASVTTTLLLTEFCHIAQLRLNIYAIRGSHLHHAASSCDINLKRLLARINHHRVKARIEATLNQFNATTVVKVYPTLNTIVRNSLASHSH
jgi:uncharacterized membrane protein YcaP (DUF421 family)